MLLGIDSAFSLLETVAAASFSPASLDFFFLATFALGLRGATFGSFGARLGTALVVGTYEPELRPGTWLWRHVEAVGVLTLVTSVEAALFAWGVARVAAMTMLFT